MNIEF
jgi:hypothetical protein